MNSRWLVFGLFLFAGTQLLAQTVVYEATLYDSLNATIKESGVKIRADILSKDSACVMYSREFTLDTTNSNGYIRVDLSQGTAPTSGGHKSNTLVNVLKNASGHQVICEDSSNYTFSGTIEKRLVKVSILEVASVDIGDVVLPTQELGVLPFAYEAQNTVTLRGVVIDGTAPNNGQVLRYNSGTNKYVPADVSATAVEWSSVLSVPADIADGDNDTTYSNATGAASGLMSSSDKSKLDGVESNATADQTAAEILAATITVDGAGSGLDADTLDGVQASSFVQTESDPTVLASVKDGVSWAEVTGKPTVGDGHSLDASDGTPANAVAVDADGKVTLSTASLPISLDVNGAVKVGDSSATCNAAADGSLRFNGGNLQICRNGSGWQTLFTGAETDPQVGTLTNTKWCTTDGSTINCTSDAPSVSETDPQVGTLTNGRWCTTNGTTINCTSTAPGGLSSCRVGLRVRVAGGAKTTSCTTSSSWTAWSYSSYSSGNTNRTTTALSHTGADGQCGTQISIQCQ